MDPKWSRPVSVKYPTTWAVVSAKKALSNGTVPRFRIQDVTEDIHEDVIAHMKECYLRDEIFAEYLDYLSDPGTITEYLGLFSDALKNRCSLVAYLENAEELKDKSLPKLAGCNIILPLTKGEEGRTMHSRLAVEWDFLGEIMKDIDAFEMYNTTTVFYAIGLSVHPSYRGLGLGEEILKCRLQLTKTLGIPVTTTIFSNAPAQRLAEKCGFHLLAEKSPKEYRKNGEALLKDLPVKTVKYMARSMK